ncbi:MAG: RNA polymerase sigma factor [Gemmatimonadota bacterium]
MSDERLARRTREGDRAAFEHLVRRYLRPIHAVVASYLSEDADVEDAVQDTFLRVLDAVDGYDPERPFAPWLYQIARNVARNRLKAMARWPQAPVPEAGIQASGPDPGVAAEQAEARELLEAAIAALPEQRRTAFRLVDVEEYSAKEVGEMMGLSPGTVRSHVHHARRALRGELRARGIERETERR